MAFAACGTSSETATDTTEAAPEGCADVIDATISTSADGTASISATISSVETGWDKYADRFDVLDGDVIIGTRVLVHPHVDEQPFTRSLTGVEIPDGRASVTIRAHDSVVGYCGIEFDLEVG